MHIFFPEILTHGDSDSDANETDEGDEESVGRQGSARLRKRPAKAQGGQAVARGRGQTVGARGRGGRVRARGKGKTVKARGRGGTVKAPWGAAETRGRGRGTARAQRRVAGAPGHAVAARRRKRGADNQANDEATNILPDGCGQEDILPRDVLLPSFDKCKIGLESPPEIAYPSEGLSRKLDLESVCSSSRGSATSSKTQLFNKWTTTHRQYIGTYIYIYRYISLERKPNCFLTKGKGCLAR